MKRIVSPMKKKLSTVALVLTTGIAAHAVPVYDDFNDGVLDPAWTGDTSLFIEGGGVLATTSSGHNTIFNSNAVIPANTGFQAIIEFYRAANAGRNESLFLQDDVGDINSYFGAIWLPYGSGPDTTHQNFLRVDGTSVGSYNGAPGLDQTGTVLYRWTVTMAPGSGPGLWNYSSLLEDVTNTSIMSSVNTIDSSVGYGGGTLGIGNRRSESTPNNFLIESFQVDAVGVPVSSNTLLLLGLTLPVLCLVARRTARC